MNIEDMMHQEKNKQMQFLLNMSEYLKNLEKNLFKMQSKN